MLRFIKDWTLPIAMIIGFAGYRWFGLLAPITPALIFAMLLLTFCKLDFAQLRPTKLHGWLLFLEIVGGIGVYYAVAPFNPIVAQAVMICVMVPTATSAAVITGKLQGNVGMVASFTLFANVAFACVVPFFFPAIVAHADGFDFWSLFARTLTNIFLLIILPFLMALLLRRYFPKANNYLIKINDLAFYLWAVALVIVIAQTFKSMIDEPMDWQRTLWIAVGSLAACLAQFFVGKAIGTRFGERIAGGQALGQKNTILAIWMAHAYLHPMAALGPGLYMFWQNTVNSIQLYLVRKHAKRQT